MSSPQVVAAEDTDADARYAGRVGSIRMRRDAVNSVVGRER
jgi:hypothetical protein